jgi:hypothetical protein
MKRSMFFEYVMDVVKQVIGPIMVGTLILQFLLRAFLAPYETMCIQPAWVSMATVSFVILQLVVFFAPIYIYLRKNL